MSVSERSEATAEGAGSEAEAELSRRLREADKRLLVELIEGHLEELSPANAKQALLNPHASNQSVRALMQARQLIASYQVRKDLALHPKTPEPSALRFAAGLYWRDQVRLSGDLRVRPLVRRQAEIQLLQRLSSLALGERIALARIAGAGLIQELRRDHSPRVIQALLENPRFTEGHLMPLVSSVATPPAVLERVARDRRWGSRYAVRCALARNRRTPVTVAVGLLSSLRKVDLRGLANDRTLGAPVRQRARLLLGQA